MKINKTFQNEEIIIGDIFYFDFTKIMDTPFCNSNFGKSLKDKDADEAYIQMVINPKNKVNVPSYKLYYLKNKEIIFSTVQSEPVFFSYVMSKDNVIHKVGNSLNIDLSVEQLESKHYENKNSDVSITDNHLNIKTENGDFINYGDLVKVDYAKLKEIQNSDNKIFNTEFFNSFENENTDDLYFHIVNMDRTHDHCFSYPEIYIYALSNGHLKNGETDEQNARSQKRFEETGDERRKPKTYITAFVGGLYILEQFSIQEVFQTIVSNNQKFELEKSDII